MKLDLFRLPEDPIEVDEMLRKLRGEFDPENRRLILAGRMRSGDVAARLRRVLTEHRHPAATAATYALESLQRAIDRPDVAVMPEWQDLRSALIEIAADSMVGELIGESERRTQAEGDVAKLAQVVARAKPLIDRQGRNAKLPKTEFYIGLIEANPTMGNAEIADHVFDTAPASNDGESHFYWNDLNGRPEMIDRSSGKSITVKQMTQQIQKARSEHVNGRKHKAKKKVR